MAFACRRLAQAVVADLLALHALSPHSPTAASGVPTIAGALAGLTVGCCRPASSGGSVGSGSSVSVGVALGSGVSVNSGVSEGSGVSSSSSGV
jgi:hypothetical protein